MQSFLLAFAFLSVVPVRFRVLPSSEAVARSRFWYPVVGLILGGLLGGGAVLAGKLQSTPLGAFLVLLAWVVLTGALHLDGWTDLCDGLFGGKNPEDRLRIMKDPHLGAFGLAGGVLMLLGKFVVLQEVLKSQPWVVMAAVLVARCLVICMAAGARYPRPEGTGKALIEAVRWWEAIVFAMIAAAGSAGIMAIFPGGANCQSSRVSGAWLGLFLCLPPFLTLMILRILCQCRLGGVTGDCLGAGIELAEWTFLLTAILY